MGKVLLHLAGLALALLSWLLLVGFHFPFARFLVSLSPLLGFRCFLFPFQFFSGFPKDSGDRLKILFPFLLERGKEQKCSELKTARNLFAVLNRRGKPGLVSQVDFLKDSLVFLKN